jgi:hypothetical protein
MVTGNDMKKHNMDPARFLLKGQVVCECRDNMFYMRADRAIPTQRFDAEHLSINLYIYLPEKYKLPLRIDIKPAYAISAIRRRLDFE